MLRSLLIMNMLFLGGTAKAAQVPRILITGTVTSFEEIDFDTDEVRQPFQPDDVTPGVGGAFYILDREARDKMRGHDRWMIVYAGKIIVDEKPYFRVDSRKIIRLIPLD